MPDPATSAAGNGWRLLGLFLAALAVRLAFLVWIVDLRTPLQGDEIDYHHIATSWLAGEGWREHVNPLEYWLPEHGELRDAGIEPPDDHRSARPPWTPLFLVAVYAITGPSITAGRVAMVAMAALIAPALLLVGQQLWGRGSKAALVAALAWVVYPFSVYTSTLLMTETWAALWVLAIVWGFHRAATTGGFGAALATGAACGALSLDRSNFLLLPLALVGGQMVFHRRAGAVRWRASQWIAAAVGMAVVLAPWTLRNWRVHHALIPATTDASRLLVACNLNLDQPMVRAGGYCHDPRWRGWIEAHPESEWSRVGWELFRRRWPLEPQGLLPGILARRAIHFWDWRLDPYEHVRRPLGTFGSRRWQLVKSARNVATGATWLPALALLVVSLWRLDARRDWPLLAIVGYTFLITLPFWGTPRFRYPIDALVVLRAMAVLFPPALAGDAGAPAARGPEVHSPEMSA